MQGKNDFHGTYGPLVLIQHIRNAVKYDARCSILHSEKALILVSMVDCAGYKFQHPRSSLDHFRKLRRKKDLTDNLDSSCYFLMYRKAKPFEEVVLIQMHDVFELIIES